MHIRDERVYQFCHEIYPLILEADVYVGEMDLHPVDIQINNPAYNLQEQYSSSGYTKIRKQLMKSFQIDIGRYAHLHPLMILSGITQNILVNDHAVSLDEHLWNYARDHDRQLQGLESAQEQLTLLHSIDPKPLYKQIETISTRPSGIRKFTARALDYYIRGEIHLLYQMTRSSMHQLRKRIIYNRNEVMVARMLSFDPSLSYFITVGAGHLSGPMGIISRLRKVGYKIRALHFRPMA
jgi:uncharacterized protein YbaP (TraB family)